MTRISRFIVACCLLSCIDGRADATPTGNTTRWRPTQKLKESEEDKLLDKLARDKQGPAVADEPESVVAPEAFRQNLFFGLGAGLVLILGFMHSSWHARRERRRSHALARRSRADGLTYPASLHPEVDASTCIGCGTCVQVCPDQTVLGIIDNKAALVTPANCVGHGLCQSSCPVGAISLVFGHEDLPVDLPRYDGRYQSNVPGIYIAGELGGMGLIANAFDQSLEAMDNLADGLGSKKGARGGDRELLDVLVVGAGPAGLAAALRAQELGLSYLCVDQDSWGGAIRSYPRAKLVMTRAIRVPLYGPVKLKETSKEQLVALWDGIVAATKVKIRPQTRVERIGGAAGDFRVETSAGVLRARRVLLALGRRGTPRKLGVPGEEASYVAYSLIDPDPWAGKRVAVVGGGDMACEVALVLAEQPGTQVALLYRGKSLSRPKAKNRERIEQAQKAGRIALILEAGITRVEPDRLHLTVAGSEERSFAVDQVFACLGGVPPTAFLRGVGIEVVTLRGEAPDAARQRPAG